MEIISIIDIIVSLLTLIVFIIINLLNNKKANERLEKSLKKEEIYQNKRIKKLYEVITDFINQIEISKEANSDRLYRKYKYTLKSYQKKGLNQLEINGYFRFLRNFLKNREEHKYLGIEIRGYIYFPFNKFRISSDTIEILVNLETKDLKNQILREIENFSKEYYDIDLNEIE